MREERGEGNKNEIYVGEMREREKYIIPTITRRINSQ